MGDNYFGRFANDVFDPDADEIVSDIVNKLDGLIDSFPDISLTNLNQLTESIKNDIVNQTGKPFPLGTIEFLKIDSESGKVVETGLEWTDATISVGSENFVVETLKSIFNSQSTRMNDEITFSELANGTNEFIEAAKKYAQMADDDLPNVPTETDYDTAVRQNVPLKLVSQKFIQKEPKSDNNKRTSAESERQGHTPSSSSPSSESVASPSLVNSLSKAASFNSAQASTVASAGSEDTNHAELKKPKSGFVPKQVSHERSLSAYQLLNGIQINVPQFKLNENVGTVGNPEQDNYVAAALNAEMNQANTFLKETGKAFTDAIKAATSQTLQRAETQRSNKINDLKSVDGSELIAQKLNRDLTKKYDQKLIDASNQAESSKVAAIEAENRRHDEELARIESNYQNSLSNLALTNKNEKEAEFNNLLPVRQSEWRDNQDKEIADFMDNFDIQVSAKIRQFINEKHAQASNEMKAAFEDLTKQLTEKRSALVKEHQEALNAKQKADEAYTNREEVQDMEQKNESLRNSQRQMIANHTQELSKKDEEIAKLKDQLDVANESKATADDALKHLQDAAKTSSELLAAIPERLLNGGVQNSTSDDLQKLLAVLEKQNQPKKSNGWRNAFIGLVATLALGSAGVGGFAYTQQLESDHQADLKKLNDSNKEARSVLEKKIVALEKKEQVSSSNTTQEASQQAANTQTQQPTATAATAASQVTQTSTAGSVPVNGQNQSGNVDTQQAK
ncbi:hypothetical protein K1728_00890 [Weissella confusa]|uniref:hypothetical protein n=1 Tax=Weissella confusa TaxID=1583 RepID=UPI001C6F9D9C|nr:hypothetical protein [Weissella confusa]QYU58002.1 hypothetical protein K1728_00890 [Weissella confusa]